MAHMSETVKSTTPPTEHLSNAISERKQDLNNPDLFCQSLGDSFDSTVDKNEDLNFSSGQV